MRRLKRTLRRPRPALPRVTSPWHRLSNHETTNSSAGDASRGRNSRGTATPSFTASNPLANPDDSPVAAIVTWTEFDQDSDSAHVARAVSDSIPDLLDRPADRDRTPALRPPPPPPTRRARWRRLLARQALLEKGLDTDAQRPADRFDEPASPRSSFDLDEPKSFASWDEEPPSPTLRSWRSVSSRSFHKRLEEPPRALAAIGRQACMNDISHLVDAANSPCISYDRQIFDPTSKLWRYVEADIPYEASPWELGPASLGSPVTTRSTAGASNSVTATPSLPTPAAMHAAAASGRRKATRGEVAAFTRGMARRHRRPWSPAPGLRRTASSGTFSSIPRTS